VTLAVVANVKNDHDLGVGHYSRPADVLGNDPLTTGGEDNFVDFARWATDGARSPREIRDALEECLWLVAWNDETGESAGGSRVWRELMREILAEH
jgi:hypothetical protein